jgi:signal transduction histidine kinase
MKSISSFPSFFRVAYKKMLDGRSIAKTLLLWILFFSSLITLSLSGIQLFIDYKSELNTINSRLDEIEHSYKNSIEASLWNVDREQLDIQLEGIRRLPDIQQVSVKEIQNSANPIVLIKGESLGTAIKRHYELIHVNETESFAIGVLTIEASLTAVYQRLINKALTIMVIQGVKTFFVSFFILFVFYRLVTRHIVEIEHFLKNVDLRHSFTELRLSREERKVPDELDHLVSAYNLMLFDLRQAYSDIRVVNDELKRDIVARKKAEAEVKLLNEELERRVFVRTAELEAANRELNAFCYSVSHDLRAPLRRIDGFRHNISVSYSHKLDQQGIHYLSRMEACTNEMNAMIESFLILSKSTSAELNLQDVSLSEVVNRVIFNLRERDEHREVAVKVQKNVIAFCDPKLVELIISNLTDNAWKYTSKNNAAEIRFYKIKRNGEQIYVIEDNGAGFNMEHAQNLFAPFTRLHKLSDFQGVGIGLATVKRVAARHGGRVWAESSVGNGAKFFFTLKARDGLEARNELIAEGIIKP